MSKPTKKKTEHKTRPRRALRAPSDSIVSALNHPVRFAALNIMAERVASPSDVAREIGETVGAVAYHVRLLRDLGAIELVEKVQRRGAFESYYRATVRPWFSDAEYGRLPARQRRAMFAPTIRGIVDGAVRALATGGFDDLRAHASRTAFDVDDEGYAEVVALLEKTVERLVEIEAESAVRGSDKTQPTEVTLLHYRPTPVADARRNGTA